MTYKARIEAMEKSFDNLTKQLHEAKEKGNHDTYADLNKKRLDVYDELSRLRRLQWEEMHDKFDLDDR